MRKQNPCYGNKVRVRGGVVHYLFFDGGRWKLPWKLPPIPRNLNLPSLSLERLDASIEAVGASIEVVEA